MISDDKIEHAKALALAMGWVARHENRWMAFVGFSGRGDTGTSLVMPPGRWDQEALYDWLEHFYGNGTVMDVPMQRLPEVFWPEYLAAGMPRGKTDVVIITDAAIRAVDDDLLEVWAAWKKQEQVRCYSIVIGQAVGQLEDICDRCWSVGDLNPGEESVIESLSM